MTAVAAAQAVAREHGVACDRGHGAEFTDELLAAYGDVGGLEPFLEAHALYETNWRGYVSGGWPAPSRASSRAP
jgi:hypothetical protein